MQTGACAPMPRAPLRPVRPLPAVGEGDFPEAFDASGFLIRAKRRLHEDRAVPHDRVVAILELQKVKRTIATRCGQNRLRKLRCASLRPGHDWKAY